MYELKKNWKGTDELESYWRVNLLGPGPRFMKKEFTGPCCLSKVEEHCSTTQGLCL